MQHRRASAHRYNPTPKNGGMRRENDVKMHEAAAQKRATLSAQLFADIPKQHTTTALVLSLMVMGAAVADAAAATKQAPEVEEMEAPQKSLKAIHAERICKKQYGAIANKPKDVRFDVVGNQLMSVECAKQRRQYQPATFQCAEETKRLNPYEQPNELVNRLEDLRARYAAKLARQASILSREVNTSKFKAMSPQQLALFNKHFIVIQRIQNAQLSEKTFRRLDIGNCGEHKDKNIAELIRLSHRTGVVIHLQWVKLAKADANDNHSFLLVNSDAPSINIQNDPVKAKAYLQNIRKGYFCDSWNNYFGKVANNLNEYYSAAFWASVSVETISLDFDYTGLPKFAIKYLNRQLHQLGLSNLHKPMPPAEDEREPEKPRHAAPGK